MLITKAAAVQLFILLNVVQVLCAWKCKANEWREWYSCEPANTTFHGIFVNDGVADTNRSIGPTVYGVQIRKRPHRLDMKKLTGVVNSVWGERCGKYRLLYFSLQNTKKNSSAWQWPETRMADIEEPHIKVAAGTATILYQHTAYCGVSNVTGDYSYLLEDKVMKLYSMPTGRTFMLNVTCTDRIADFPLISWENETDVKYNEGVADRTWSPQHSKSTAAAGPDSSKFFTWLNSKLHELNLNRRTGLNWNKYTLREYGFEEKRYHVEPPPDQPPPKRSNVYQAKATCGPLTVEGWVFPVFHAKHIGDGDYRECTSPEFVPVCISLDAFRPGRPEQQLDDCRDYFREIRNAEWGYTIIVKYGIQGRFADKLGETFRAAFIAKLQTLGPGHESAGFNWSRIVAPDWPSFGTMTKNLGIPAVPQGTKLVALQLFGECGSYTVGTQEVALVEVSKATNKCLRVLNAVADSCAEIQKWVDNSYGWNSE